ncbi:MAG: GAF domain-containing protein [Chloroflexi bacterium]|nr:GAF domain-containing protein [Chloroflexota bacterium]
MGGAGIVGYVALTGRPRIALDTSADVVFFNNPDLPETRSEISLPLKYGNTVVGVLDVQSLHPSAFSNDDADTLSALANQIAIVIRKYAGGGRKPLRRIAGRPVCPKGQGQRIFLQAGWKHHRFQQPARQESSH